jgi:hypothetical protein
MKFGFSGKPSTAYNKDKLLAALVFLVEDLFSEFVELDFELQIVVASHKEIKKKAMGLCSLRRVTRCLS